MGLVFLRIELTLLPYRWYALPTTLFFSVEIKAHHDQLYYGTIREKFKISQIF